MVAARQAREEGAHRFLVPMDERRKGGAVVGGEHAGDQVDVIRATDEVGDTFSFGVRRGGQSCAARRLASSRRDG